MTDSDVQNFVDFCESDFGTAVMNREAAYIEAQIGDANRILDIGSGIGAIEERLDSDIVGIDASSAMLKEASQRTDNQYVVGDAATLPLYGETFDAVISVTCIEFLEDYRAVIDEVSRVLRPGGRFVALLLNPESRYFQQHAEKEDSYFHRMKHDPAVITNYAAERFVIDTEYFLGIDGQDLFASDDPDVAALISLIARSQ